MNCQVWFASHASFGELKVLNTKTPVELVLLSNARLAQGAQTDAIDPL